MRCRPAVRPATGVAIQFFAFVLIGPTTLAAGAPDGSFGDERSTPQLTVRVYSSVKVSSVLLQMSESEAARMLRDVPVTFSWVNCTPQSFSAVCKSEATPTDLVVRILKNALPQAGSDALGIAGGKRDDTVAFVFYDRMVDFRSHTRLLPSIMGRVLAHEMVHLLLPDERHSDSGLMRGLWTREDLRTDSSDYLGIPPASMQLIQKEALRRVGSEAASR